MQKTGLDQTHLFANQEPELASVQVQVAFLNHSAWKGSYVIHLLQMLEEAFKVSLFADRVE
jgi:hypothetical protein